MGKLLKRKYATFAVWGGVAVIGISHFLMFISTTAMTLSEAHTHALINLVALGVLTFGGSQMGGN